MRLEQAVEIYLLSKMFLKFIGITLIGYFFFCVIVRVLTNNAKKKPVEFSILDDSNEELAKTLNGDKGFLRAKITAWLIKFVKNIQLYNSQLVSKKEMVTQNRLRKLYLLDITGHLIVGFSFSSGLIELQNQLLAGIFLPLVYVVVGSLIDYKVMKIRANLGSYLIDKGSFFLVPGLPLLLMINLLWVGAGLLISNLQAETLVVAGFDVGITDMFLGIAAILLGLIGVLLQVKRLKAILKRLSLLGKQAEMSFKKSILLKAIDYIMVYVILGIILFI